MKLLKILLLFVLSTSLFAQGYFLTPKSISKTINTTQEVDSVTNSFLNKYPVAHIKVDRLNFADDRTTYLGKDARYNFIHKTSSTSGPEIGIYSLNSYSGALDAGRWTQGFVSDSKLEISTGSYDGRIIGLVGAAFDSKTGGTHSGASAYIMGINGLSLNTSSIASTVPNIGIRGEVLLLGSGGITNAYSFYANSYDGGGGVITNYYGYYSRGHEGSPSTNTYHFYGNGNYPSYFGGDVRAGAFRLNALNTAPAASTSTGTTGEIRIDANYIYICVATNTWKRVALNETTW